MSDEKLNTEGKILKHMVSGSHYLHSELVEALGYTSAIVTTSIRHLLSDRRIRSKTTATGHKTYSLDDSEFNSKIVLAMPWREHSNEAMRIESHYFWSVI